MDGRDFQGRLLHILPAVDRKPANGEVEGSTETAKKQSVKASIQEKRKTESSKEFNWAVLYMNVRRLVTQVCFVMAVLTRRSLPKERRRCFLHR